MHKDTQKLLFVCLVSILETVVEEIFYLVLEGLDNYDYLCELDKSKLSALVSIRVQLGGPVGSKKG